MKISNTLRRMRTQVYSMERMLRLLRSNLEEELHNFGADDDLDGAEIPTALGTLLQSDEDIPMSSVTPYSNFAPGVWIGYDVDEPGIACNVMTRNLRRVDSKEMGPSVTRLLVNPVFSSKEKAKWLTLETEIDTAAFLKADTIRMDLIAYFTLANGNRVPLPKSFKIAIRMTDPAGEVSDIDFYRAPVTTMPLEYGCSLSLQARQKLNAEKADRIVLIMLLPEAGDYTFNLDHFSVHAIKG